MVTSPGLDSRAVFIKMRQIIGAGEQYAAFDQAPDPTSDMSWERDRAYSHNMQIGQGLPALMWVDHNRGELVSTGGHGEYCEPDCDGEYDDPAGYIEINYDTAYGYRADNNASCSDLHAWITQEIGAWLDQQGASWQWYDESGYGWNHGEGWGTLGDPEVGALGSSVRRVERDEKRAFGALALAAVLGGETA